MKKVAWIFQGFPPSYKKGPWWELGIYITTCDFLTDRNILAVVYKMTDCQNETREQMYYCQLKDLELVFCLFYTQQSFCRRHCLNLQTGRWLFGDSDSGVDSFFSVILSIQVWENSVVSCLLHVNFIKCNSIYQLYHSIWHIMCSIIATVKDDIILKKNEWEVKV